MCSGGLKLRALFRKKCDKNKKGFLEKSATKMKKRIKALHS